VSRSALAIAAAVILLLPRSAEAQRIVTPKADTQTIGLVVVLDTLHPPQTASFRWLSDGEGELVLHPQAGQSGLNEAMRALMRAVRNGVRPSSRTMTVPAQSASGRQTRSPFWDDLVARPYADWQGRPARYKRTRFVIHLPSRRRWCVARPSGYGVRRRPPRSGPRMPHDPNR
jgi:hypothetical protein